MLGNILGIGFRRHFRYLDQRLQPRCGHRRRVPARGRAEPDLCRHPGAAAGGRVRRRPAAIGTINYHIDPQRGFSNDL